MTPVGRRRRSLTALAVGLVLALSTWFSVTAALPGLRDDLSLGAADRRWVTTVLQVCFAAASVAIAATGLVDRVRPRRLAVLGALLAAGANALPVLVPDRTALLGSRALVGAALALVYPPLLKAAGGWAGSAARGRVMGAMIACLTLGSASPHLVSSVDGIRWEAVLLTTSAAAVLAAAVVHWGADDGPAPTTSGTLTSADVTAVLTSRPLRLTCLGYVGHMWELYAGWAAVAPFMLAVWADARTAGLASFAIVAVGGGAAALGGAAGDRIGRERAAIVAMVTSASLVAVLGFTVGRPVLATALALVWGAAVIADSGHFPALLTDHADPARVGSALSLQLALGFGVTGLATWLVPAVQARAGWGWGLACLAPGPLLGALALRRLQAHQRAHLMWPALARPTLIERIP